jgi:hypothetical protein
MKSLVLAFALAALPAAALAACPEGSQTMICAEGTIWDPATGTCVPVVLG